MCAFLGGEPKSFGSSSERVLVPVHVEEPLSRGQGLRRGAPREGPWRTWVEHSLSPHRRTGRARAARFHAAQLLCWAWSRWREVRLWHKCGPRGVMGRWSHVSGSGRTYGLLHGPSETTCFRAWGGGQGAGAVLTWFHEMIGSQFRVLLAARLFFRNALNLKFLIDPVSAFLTPPVTPFSRMRKQKLRADK